MTTGVGPQANPAAAFDPDRDADPVPSPCINVCRLDTGGTYCMGCLRTRAEIAGWRGMADSGKREVWRALRARRHAPEKETS